MVIRVVAKTNLVIPGFEIVAEFAQRPTSTRIEEVIIGCVFRGAPTSFQCAVANTGDHRRSIRQGSVGFGKWIKWVSERNTDADLTHRRETISLLECIRCKRHRR